MKNIIIVLFCLILSGCIGKKRLARLCNQKFPPSIETRTDYFQEDSLRVGTYYLPPTYKPFLCPPSDTGVLVFVPCPPARLDTLIVTKTTTHTVRDSAKMFLLSQKIVENESKIAQLTLNLASKVKQNRILIIAIVIILLVIGAIIGLSARRFLARLF
jgi:hypothetical protein